MRKFRMQVGMKEHPMSYVERGIEPPRGRSKLDHELLYPGDVFECDESRILKPQTEGGWLQLEGVDVLHGIPGQWRLVCCVPVAEASSEERVIRDEPSVVIGFNMSEEEFESRERASEKREEKIYPRTLPRRKERAPK